jgi:DNA-binding protein YbaB
MALQFSLLLTADGRLAKSEIDGTAAAVGRLGKAAEGATGRGRAAAGAIDGMTAAANRNAVATATMARSNQLAAGSAGNLVAQFNDIGVMLAAGQNPLILAIQQGTQISQVLGAQGGGAAGAVRALGQGLLGLLSPTNLLTIGAVAAGAAFIQWLTSSGEGAASLEDQLAALKDAVDAVREGSTQSAADLRAEFGALTPEVLRLQAELQGLRIRDLMAEASGAVALLRGEISSLFDFDFSVEADLATLLDVGVFGDSIKELNPQIVAMMDAFSALERADGVGAQLEAVRQLKDAFTAAVDVSGALTGEQQAFYRSILDTEAQLTAAAVATGDISAGIVAGNTEATKLGGAAETLFDVMGRIAALDLSGPFTKAFPAAQQLGAFASGLATQLAAIAGALAENGPGNILIAPGGEIFARGTYTEGGMDAAARGEARKRPNPFGRLASGAAGAARPSVGSGGGAAAEKDGVEDLIATLNDEIATLRELDPIQKAMLQYRQELAGATDAERAQVEELIGVRIREQAAMEAVQARKDFFEQTGADALEALIVKGESLEDVLKRVASAFLEAAIQGALFGSGPFGDFFGGTSILSGLFGGGKKDGGMIHGRGDGRSDSNLFALSNGEFVVNARATARHRNLLETINGGGFRGFADGGLVGTDIRPSAGSAGSRPRDLNVHVHGARGDREIRQMVEEGVRAGLTAYDREVLPQSVERVSGDRRSVG